MIFLFAINPASGGVAKTTWETSIHQFFGTTSHQIELLHLTGQNDGTLIEEAMTRLHPDRVVAVGGDGTIKCVATALLGTDIPLGILPAGSANGMARELGIPTDVEQSLEVLVNGSPKLLDVIDVNKGDICLHLSDIGLNARVVRYYQRNNLRGKFGYVRSVLNVLRKHRLLRVQVQLGDTYVQRAALMVVLANARMYGTGAVINPEGDPSDGQFEVVIFRRLSFWEILKLFWRYRPFDPKRIEIFPATSIQIDTHRKAYFQVDGEYRGRITRLEAHIRPGALRVMRPNPV